MAAVVARRVRTSQPQHNAQIDWANPITAGLVFAYTMLGEAQGWGEDGRNGIQYVQTSTGTPVGKAINTLTGQAGQVLSGGPYLFGAPAQSSIKSGVYSMFAFGTGPTTGMQSALDDDDGTTRRMQFRLNAGKVELIPFYSGGNGDVIAPVALSANDLATGFAMGAVVNGTSAAVYQKGTKTAATLASAALTPNTNIAVGARKTGTSQQWLSGGLMIVAMWNRALTDAEQQSLADSPWQIFKAQPTRRLWLAWSASTSVDGNATITGVSGTTSTGTAVASGDASTTMSGVQSSSSVGAVAASGSANTTIAGVQATSSAASVSASGGASTGIAGVTATTSTGTVAATGDATATLSSVQATASAGAVVASAGGNATATITGVSCTGSVGAIVASGDALTSLSSVSATTSTGNVSASGDADVTLSAIQVAASVATIAATGTSGDVIAYLQGVAAATSVGTIAATGTRTTITVNVTEDMICRVVRSYLLSIAPNLRVLRTPVNRAAMPNGPYVSFTPGLRRPLSTNVSGGDSNSRTIRRPEQMSFQIDCYGAGSDDLAETINALYRDQYAVDLFTNSGLEIVPLYAGDIQQAPFVSGEDQYEDRYTFEIELQVNSVIVVPLQSCNILGIDLVSVDAEFPPT